MDPSQFSGSEYYYKHFTGLLYTDGVQYLAETFGAYWLIDAIASYARKEPFQLWELAVHENSATLTCREDSGLRPVVTQEIEYTDFPENIKLYVSNNVLMLPREY
jgi:hypothetical protein